MSSDRGATRTSRSNTLSMIFPWSRQGDSSSNSSPSTSRRTSVRSMTRGFRRRSGSAASSSSSGSVQSRLSTPSASPAASLTSLDIDDLDVDQKSTDESSDESVNETINVNEDEDDSQNEQDAEVLDLPALQRCAKRVSRVDRRRFTREFVKELPATEQLCKVFTCALSKEILFQGKMYVTARFVCFYSRLFNITQKLIIPFGSITKLEPRMTITFIPNGIAIYTTKGDKQVFASFSNRNRTLDVLRQLRNAPFNTLASRPHALARSESTTSARSRTRAAGSPAGPSPNTLDPTRAQKSILNQQAASPPAGSSSLVLPQLTVTADEPKSYPVRPTRTSSEAKPSAPRAPSRQRAMSTPAPVARDHAPTSLPDPLTNEKVLVTEKIQAPLSVVADLLFGDDTAWLRHFLTDVDKNRDLGEIPKFASHSADQTRSYEYTKPLNGPVGPKQTKCKCTEKISKWDLDSYIDVVTATATPDVPSGSAFTTQTRIVLAWGPNSGTQMRLGTWLDWTGKSWLKGPIEKGAIDGQTAFCKSLVKEVRQKVRGGSATPPEPRERERSETDPEATEPSTPPRAKRRSAAAQKAVKSLQEWQRLCAILAGCLLLSLALLLWALLTRGPKQPHPHDVRELQRVQEELNLWQWIDDRKGLHRAIQPALNMDVHEAIAQSEQRLARLKAQLSG